MMLDIVIPCCQYLSALSGVIVNVGRWEEWMTLSVTLPRIPRTSAGLA